MKILFRVDGNLKVGFGHLIRCISIVKELRTRNLFNIDLLFLGSFSESALNILSQNNIFHTCLSQSDEIKNILISINAFNPDIIFIDNTFSYSSDDIERLKKKCRICIMQNFCHGASLANILIMPTAHTPDFLLKEYNIDKNAQYCFIGADYIVLNNNILNLKKSFSSPKDKLLKLIITTGGSDPKRVMIKLLTMLKNSSFPDILVKVLYGTSIDFKNELDFLKNNLPENFEIKPFDEKDLIDADFAISTFGITTYELLYLGIPVISVAHAPRNALGSKTLAERYNNIIDIGLIDDLKEDVLLNSINTLINNPELRNKMSLEGKKLVDGKGVKRVVDLLLN